MEHFFSINNEIHPTGEGLVGDYNLWLVTISILVAILGSYIAFQTSARNIQKRHGWPRIGWIAFGSISLGFSIWTMHFIGMLAFNLHLPVFYDLQITIFSIIPAILASAIVLHTISKSHLPSIQHLMAAVMMGSGIGAMHYSGMLAMRLDAHMTHDLPLFLLSIFVAVGLSWVSLGIQRWIKGDQWKQWILASIVLGCSVSAMHYTAMAAANFIPNVPSEGTPEGIDTLYFKYATAISTTIILLLMTIASALDKYRQIMAELRIEINYRQKAESALRETMEGLEEQVRERTKALRITEAKSREVVNSAVDAIITIDHKGNIMSFNTSAEQVFDYSATEIIGRNVNLLMPKPMSDNHNQYLKNYSETGVKKVIGVGREVVGQRKDGSTFPIDLSVSEFISEGEKLFVGIVRDITIRKQAEEKLNSTLDKLRETQQVLVESEKMASLGGLVAGISHEINTPVGVGLTAVTHLHEQANALAQKLESGQLKKSDLAKFVDTAVGSTNIIEANLNRASDLIRSFKQVAVDQSSEETRKINLLDYVEEVLQSLRPKLKRSHHAVNVTGDRSIVVDTHPGALSQILTNLIMNSLIHAYEPDDKGEILISAEHNDKNISLTYSDDGKGMSSEVSSKIFEPFFTTNRGSGGSGLGMHILYNQVTQTLGGTIKLDSTPGKGSVFEIIIPLQTGESQ